MTQPQPIFRPHGDTGPWAWRCTVCGAERSGFETWKAAADNLAEHDWRAGHLPNRGI